MFRPVIEYLWHIVVEHKTWNDRPELLQNIYNNTVGFY